MRREYLVYHNITRVTLHADAARQTSSCGDGESAYRYYVQYGTTLCRYTFIIVIAGYYIVTRASVVITR